MADTNGNKDLKGAPAGNAPAAASRSSGASEVKKTPGEWGRALGIKPHHLAGAVALARLDPETPITEKEFRRAYDRWADRPFGRRAAKARR